MGKTIGGIEFIEIKGGTYTMGARDKSDKRPKAKVTIDSFLMGKNPVTQKQFAEIMGFNPSRFQGESVYDVVYQDFIPLDGDRTAYPVDSVTWYEAVEFCKRFSEKNNVKARLPYEAEWEYACWSDARTNYYWGDEQDLDYCWVLENSGRKTHAVGTRKPNAFGLYDLIGNIHEWCLDRFNPSGQEQVPDRNPTGPERGTCRVYRGGCYISHTTLYAFRDRNEPHGRSHVVGFRILISDNVLFDYSKVMQRKKKQQPQESDSKVVIIQINDKIGPEIREQLYEEPLRKFLEFKKFGEITGGGTQLKSSGEISYSEIEICLHPNTNEENAAQEIIRLFEEMRCPKGSKIIYGDGTKLIQFGDIEGMAIYLDGINLSDDVYANCDVDYVYDKVKELIGSNDDIYRFWDGNEETALYFYGESFVKMKKSVIDFVDTYPLCENARIFQIA